MSPYIQSQAGTNSKGMAFIAMPFDGAFDPLHTAIRGAVIKANLFPYRTDQSVDENDWSQSIYMRTKQASIFIAVCSPEPTTKVPNPNVMYELGWADCYGKPTVLITTDARSIPSDLKTRNMIIYSNSKLKLKTLESDLCARIQALTANSAQPPPLAGHLLPQALLMLDFVKKLHHAFQLLSTLDDLKKVVEEYLTRGASDETAGHQRTFRQAWQDYERVFTLVQDEFIVPCSRQRAEMERVFRELGSVIASASLAKMRRYYEELNHKAIELFPDLHRKMSPETGRLAMVDAGSPNELMAYWPRLETMSRTAREIISVADNLIFALIGLMTPNGSDHA